MGMSRLCLPQAQAESDLEVMILTPRLRVDTSAQSSWKVAVSAIRFFGETGFSGTRIPHVTVVVRE